MNFLSWNNTERQDFILLLQLHILQAMYKSVTFYNCSALSISMCITEELFNEQFL